MIKKTEHCEHIHTHVEEIYICSVEPKMFIVRTEFLYVKNNYYSSPRVITRRDEYFLYLYFCTCAVACVYVSVCVYTHSTRLTTAGL